MSRSSSRRSALANLCACAVDRFCADSRCRACSANTSLRFARLESRSCACSACIRARRSAWLAVGMADGEWRKHVKLPGRWRPRAAADTMGGKPRGGGPPPSRRKPRKPRRKIVVRDLPPHLPADVFWSTVSPWVRIAAGTPSTDGAQPVRAAADQPATVVYAEYIPGKRSERYVARLTQPHRARHALDCVPPVPPD